MKNDKKKTIKFPLTFNKITKIQIITNEGIQEFDTSTFHQTKQYHLNIFYKKICNII